jgi:hypothetical protein
VEWNPPGREIVKPHNQNPAGSECVRFLPRDRDSEDERIPRNGPAWSQPAPDKFSFPSDGTCVTTWVHVRLDAIDAEEMRELVLDAWRMVVPRKVTAEYLPVHWADREEE